MKTGYLTNVAKLENRIAMTEAKIRRLDQWIDERINQRREVEKKLCLLRNALMVAKQKT